MSKFNANKSKGNSKDFTYEGAKSYKKDTASEWMNFLFSSYLEDTYYEKSNDQTNRYIELTNEVGKQYGWDTVAKMSIFARNELGLRSISQLTAAIVNDKKINNKRNFYRNFPHRLDDVSEIFGALDFLGSKRSHAIVRGFSDYLSSLNDYTLGKYKMKNKEYNLYDLINITHAHSSSIDKYKNNTLDTPRTWEVAISTSKNEEEKSKEWKSLVEDNSLGYLALIRNIRNIVNCNGITNDWIKNNLYPQLINENKIKKSLVYPYQIYCAYKNIGIRNSLIDEALSKAFFISCGNMPDLPGKNIVMLDVSGSMENKISRNSNLTIKEVGAVYGAAILISSEADFVKFGTFAKIKKINMLDNIFEIINKMQENENCGYGTNISEAFEILNKRYDRIFLISDMQTMNSNSYDWYDRTNGRDCYEQYCDLYSDSNNKPHIYSFDLGNYHTQVGNPKDSHVHLLTALNDKVFSFIKFLENGEDLIKYIDNNYNYC